MEKRQCLECQMEFYGRADKKFCSDPCRNSFHNRENAEANNYIRAVNHIMRKNRRIIFELNPDGTAKVNKQEMLLKGFDFKYFTNIYTTSTGKTYHFCYDMGYLFLEGDMVALVVKKEYVK